MARLSQKWSCLLGLLLLSSLGVEVRAQTNCHLPAEHNAETVRISHIHDGDTLTLSDGRKIRLLGINTPEMSARPSYGADFAPAAKRAVKAFFGENSSAYLVTGKQQRDNHGRWLGHLYNTKGQNLEAMLLSQGLGWHVVVPPNTHLADCLARAESSAAVLQTGVWKLKPVDTGSVSYGGFQRVRGKVKKVTLAGAWWINLQGNLSGVIYPENQDNSDPDRIRQLVGKTIELQGWVYPSRSKKYQPWRMKIETPYALEVLP